jgi:hypothetical protein
VQNDSLLVDKKEIKKELKTKLDERPTPEMVGFFSRGCCGTHVVALLSPCLVMAFVLLLLLLLLRWLFFYCTVAADPLR